MTRTAAYKTIYFATVLGTTIAAGALAYRVHAPALFLVGLVLMLLIPGRVLGFFWRDLLAGLRLLNLKDYAQSKGYSERFILRVRQKPWLKHLIWLGSGSYSRDPEVMALNNLGAAEIGLRQFDSAKSHLEEAIGLDPKCPLPFRNMGVLMLHTGPGAAAEPWFEKARALGLRGGLSDQIVSAAQARFAATDGRSNTPVPATPAIGAPAEPQTGDCIVVLINDDQTKMEFVVQILENVFGQSRAQALKTMLEVHEHGRGACGAYDRAIAEAKAETVGALARVAGFPLKCVVEARPDFGGH